MREIDHVAAIENAERGRIADIRDEVAQQRLDDRPQRAARQHGVAEVETGDAETEPAALRNGLEIAEFGQGLDQAERRPAIEISPCGNLTQGQLEGFAGETLEHGKGLADGGDIILGIFGASFRYALRCLPCDLGHARMPHHDSHALDVGPG
jgi:hypothetical protein